MTPLFYAAIKEPSPRVPEPKHPIDGAAWMPLDLTSITSIVTIVGALGVSSFGLLDATKVFGGGVSLAGLGDIEKAILPLFGDITNKKDLSTPLTYGSIYANLKAHWFNGVPLEKQKANAAAQIRLSLTAATAAAFAKAAGVAPDVLTELAVALNLGAVLTKEETDVLSRFETALSLMLDRAFQRADQRYRNSAKALSAIISILIAVIGGAICSSNSVHVAQSHGTNLPYWNTGNFWLAILVGVIAAPLAPIAKEVTSALAAGCSLARKAAAK